MRRIISAQAIRYLKKTIHLVCLFLLVILCVRAFLFEPGVTDGRSMEMTFVDNDIFLINKFALLFREPTRGDLVQINMKRLNEVVLKRVIGLPGEKITFRNGDVYIIDAQNQETKLEEPYLNKQHVTKDLSNPTFVSIPVPDHMYFVLGDNREMSTDSRMFGFVHRSDIFGLVEPLPASLSLLLNHHK